MNRELKYEFKGFNPDDKFKEYVVQTVNELYFSAPSDSGLNLTLEKTKELIRASCRIASQAGVFTAEAAADSAMQAMKQIEKKINEQLWQWKTHRRVA